MIVPPFSRQTIPPDPELTSTDYGYASRPVESHRDRPDTTISGIPVDYNGPHLGEAVSPWDEDAKFGQAVSEVVIVVVIVL